MATYPLTWLADVLRAAGCKVIEEDGWKTRGRDGSFTPKAIMLHHDASPAGETSNGVDVIRDGRPGLAGPLSQLWLAYDGTWHVVAAGRANHAGEGGPWGVISADDGNGDAIGIETDHTTDERWSDPQRSEGLRGVHALTQHMGITTREEIDRAVTAHKEYAPDRKVDPDPMDMDNARAQLAAYDDEAPEEGLFGMSILTAFSNTEVQTFKGEGDFRGVYVNPDNGLNLASGPRSAYHVVTGLTIQGSGKDDSVVPGDVVQACYQAVLDYSDDRASVVKATYPIEQIEFRGGSTFATLTWLNSLAEHDDGVMRLRLFIRPPEGKTLKVTKVLARIIY